jgi:CRP/FNR family transcriptional regulator
MIDTSQKHLVLQRYPMLIAPSGRTLDDALASATYMKVPAGTLMFEEDQPCMGFPLLISGSARVIKAAPNGRELHLYDVHPGEACVLTSRCLVDSARYEARGITREELELVVLPPAAFQILIASVGPFRDFVFRRFAERMADLLQLISAVTFQKLDQRLAASLAARPSPIHVTHQALADELGSLREIVSRLLKNFESQGWVRLGREQIEVLDTAALRQLSVD